MNREALKDSGFTLAELLVVTVVVAVLVAIAIPVFVSQIAAAKEATDAANCRSAKAAATIECLSDHGGDFSKLDEAAWVQIALDHGIPEHGQVDPGSTLNCEIAADNKSITFFYGEGGDSPTPDPDAPSGGGAPGEIILVDSTGKEHIVVVSGNWEEKQKEQAAGGTNQVHLGIGMVYSDESGVYVAGNNDSVLNIAGKTLAEVASTGNSLFRIDSDTKIWTLADKTNGKWSGQGPKKGDIVYLNGVYKYALSDTGVWSDINDHVNLR